MRPAKDRRTALAQPQQTLAIYMGVGLLETLQARLIASGMEPTTPFALVENGSLPRQRIVTGRLSALARQAGTTPCNRPRC